MDLSQVGQVITALAAFASALTGFGAMLMSWRNSRQITENSAAIEVVHRATNSLKDELVAEVRESSHAQGLKQGRAETGHGKRKLAPRKPKHK